MTATDAAEKFRCSIACSAIRWSASCARSTHAADFVKVLDRMGSYANQSFPLHVRRNARPTVCSKSAANSCEKTRAAAQADFLARVNLSYDATWRVLRLQNAPRPKGRATARRSLRNTICRARPSSRMT